MIDKLYKRIMYRGEDIIGEGAPSNYEIMDKINEIINYLNELELKEKKDELISGGDSI